MTQQSDAEHLEEIRQRWTDATPGPWRTFRHKGNTFIDDGSPFHCVAKIATGWEDHGDANAQAIAAAPTDMLWLISVAGRAIESEAPHRTAESLTIDTNYRVVSRGDTNVRLSKYEYLLFLYLVVAKRAVSHDELLNSIWKNEVQEQTVRVTVAHVRKKLGADSIATSRGYYAVGEHLRDIRAEERERKIHVTPK